MKNLKLGSLDLFILLILFHLVFNIIWIRFNNTAPSWDPAAHTAFAFKYYWNFRAFLEGNFDKSDFFLNLSDNYGPLARMITGFFLLLFSPSIKLVQFTNTVYFIMVLFVIYKLGRLLYQNQWVGLLAAFIFSFYQIIYDYSRWFWLDMLFVFFLLLFNYFLLESNFLEKTDKINYLIISGFLAVITKFQAIIFLFLPTAYTIFLLVKRKRWDIIIKLIKSFLTFLPIPLFWLIFSYKNLYYYFFRAAAPRPIVDLINYFDPTTWFHYLKLFIDYEVTFFGFLIFVIALYFYFKAKDVYRRFLFLTIVFYYIYFTLFPNKDMRFLFPILPYISFIFAKGLVECLNRKKNLGIFLISAYLFFHLIMYFSLSFGFPFSKEVRKVVYLPYLQDIVYFNLSNYPVRQFDARKWPYEEILEDLKKEAKNKTLEFVLIPSYENFNANDFKMYFALNRIKNIVVIETDKRSFLPDELDNFMRQYDYYLYTPNEVGTFFQLTRKAYEQIRDGVTLLIKNDKAVILKTYKLPSGEDLALVRKK